MIVDWVRPTCGYRNILEVFGEAFNIRCYYNHLNEKGASPAEFR